MVRRAGLAALLALGIVGTGTAAQAVPTQPEFPLVTVGCADGAGGFDSLQVQPHGSVAFVFDDGVPTGEKLFLVQIDLAVFTDAGAIVDEFHKTYGKRTGHGDPIFCSGSFEVSPDATAFFDVLVTRR